jgi:NAD-dependent dihydropyrimidine dehydrogenase PreA subunit
MLLPLEGNLLNLSIEFPRDTTVSIISCLIAGFVLAAIFLKHRFFCFICPVRGLMRLFDIRFFWRLRKNPARCNFCGKCEEVCPMGVRDIRMEDEAKSISPRDCIFCLRCVDECPEKGAIEGQVLKK